MSNFFVKKMQLNFSYHFNKTFFAEAFDKLNKKTHPGEQKPGIKETEMEKGFFFRLLMHKLQPESNNYPFMEERNSALLRVNFMRSFRNSMASIEFMSFMCFRKIQTR